MKDKSEELQQWINGLVADALGKQFKVAFSVVCTIKITKLNIFPSSREEYKASGGKPTGFMNMLTVQIDAVTDKTIHGIGDSAIAGLADHLDHADEINLGYKKGVVASAIGKVFDTDIFPSLRKNIENFRLEKKQYSIEANFA